MNLIASEKISSNIKKKIAEMGLSVHALEKRAELKQSAVQNILYGKSKKPSLHLIHSIAKVLNCTVSELLEEAAPMPQQSEQEEKKIPSLALPWNADLYIDTLNTVNLLTKKKNIPLTKDKLFACAEEIYSYSLKTHKTKPDKHFADWLIDKSCT